MEYLPLGFVIAGIALWAFSLLAHWCTPGGEIVRDNGRMEYVEDEKLLRLLQLVGTVAIIVGILMLAFRQEV